MKFISEITVKPIQHCGDDATIAGAAWVSTSAAEAINKIAEEPDSVPGLINYLMKHKHGTPFEHGFLTVYVHAPIFVWREWHRHRIGFSYNEESARYHTLEPCFYIPAYYRPMKKVDNWRPGRPKFEPLNLTSMGEPGTQDNINWVRLKSNLEECYQFGYECYLENLDMGFDPGLARDCLPVGIYSSCWVSMNPRSLMAFLSLRTHDPEAKHVSYPLYEIEVAARKLEQIFAELWPETYKAFCKNGRVAP